jgi:two-component system sensor histidine kinase KdpD
VVAIARPDGGAPVPATRATLLSTLLGQAALAHERLLLEDQLRDIRVLEERDRLRSALLSSIGHDLRTPLTAVAGAIDAVAVRHPEEAAIPVARAELARLRRFLSNLVEMVRFDTGAVSPEIEPTDLTDAVAAAVHDVRDLLPDERVRFRVPPDLPLVPADARLLHHVLLNLLTNAAVHGAGVVTITGERTRDAVRLSVADEGPGLPPGGTDALFEAFARGTGSDETGGSGLGLAIARSFAGAMDVTVVAREGEAGGAVFTLEFVVTPLDRTPA